VSDSEHRSIGLPLATATVDPRARGGVSMRIDRLVIDGLDLTPAQGAAVAQSLERELRSLLRATAGNVGWSGGAMAAAVAPTFRLPTSIQPVELGRELARSVYATLKARP
jgi:hypothetical protein